MLIKKHRKVAILVALLGIGLAVALVVANWDNLTDLVAATAPGPSLSGVDEGLVSANNQFAFDLYAQLARDNGDDNIFFSPLSVSAIMAQTYAGARGNTAREMKEVLHFDLEPDRLHTAMAALLASLEPPQGKTLYELNIANALWVEQSYSLLPDFVSLCRNHYRAVARPVDFKTAPDAQRKTINDWVEQHTNDKITNLFPPGVPDAGTRLVLTNAVYFKGSWKNKFDPARTHEAAFTLADGKSVQVPMMEQEQYFNYWPERDLQVLEMPYAGDTLSMVVLLPSKTDGLADLEKVLDAKTLGDWLGKLRNQKVAAFLPRFTTTSSSRLDHPLQALGIHDAFSSSVADLSGMTGKKDLFISAVVHKAFVDVNEEGTKAAAATGVEAKSEPYRFRADHPFIFLIRDMRSGSILFIGRVMNPKE